jgi:hypothetical protein
MDYHHSIATDGKGVWNIDEFRVTKMDPNLGTIFHDTTYFDYGTITFSGNKDEAVYEMEKPIELTNYVLGPISGPAEFLTSDILLHIGSGTGLLSNFLDCQIIKIEKNEMILFCPWWLSTVTDMIYDVEFYFKLSK